MLEGLPYVAILLLLLLLLLLLVLFLILLFIFLFLLCASRLSTRQSKVDGTLVGLGNMSMTRPDAEVRGRLPKGMIDILTSGLMERFPPLWVSLARLSRRPRSLGSWEG